MNDSDGNKRLAGVTIRRGRFFRKFYMYLLAALAMYTYDPRPGRRLLTVWDEQGRLALQCHVAHLTDFPVLLRALHHHVRDRCWPPNP
jgi:hypothetical protein